ncbi:hypothetical protein [Sphingomonas sp. ACRSK]|uniref:hypothetical protein n=1 Tax=Sphingomonas sp. ACRSK TaxID=2918213 RepID=UPI001EF45E37|nr:hypothetical protein [Sphingomonas sp. ACRSK]MCG7349287.1 hypothetical protein [Sphingomonas sp. ACRSK]
MWNTPDIDDLQLVPADARRKPATGYEINLRNPHLMSEDLEPFVVTPTNPARRFAGDEGSIVVPLAPEDPGRPGKLDFSKMSQVKPEFQGVFLVFPNFAAVLASSLGARWVEPVHAIQPRAALG